MQMTLTFGPNITGNRRGELQLWIEQHVDRDTDFWTSVVSQRSGDYVYLRADWHKSDSDQNRHLTGDVFYVRCYSTPHRMRTRLDLNSGAL